MGASHEKQTILIVDDEPANIRILREIVQDENEILFATNGHDALDIAVSERPDLILLDIVMPEMDGFQVCQRLKGDPRTEKIPVVFVTAMNELEDETAGLELGAIDYIIKPVRAPIVRARVRNHLKLKKYGDTLENLASIDGLTGVANRRQFDEVIELEWNRGIRASTPISLTMIDIDFFKQFNDHYGHAAGDECLKQVAATLAACVRRPTDLVARYGGEEFAMVLPNTSQQGAVEIAEAVRNGIRECGIPHAGSAVADHVTVSQGVATTVPDRGVSPASLMHAADVALYEAKNAGRNRLQTSSDMEQ